MTMGFAPLSFLRGRQPSRRTIKYDNPCHFLDSQERPFLIEFLTPTKDFPFSHRQVFPARKPGESFQPSMFTPPPHYHLLQDEYFRIESGKGIWYLNGGQTIHLQKGDDICVTRHKWHWFEVDPESDEPLTVLHYYDKEYTEMEYRFFRNTLTYLVDCRDAGIQMSLFQLQVFSMHNWMSIALINMGPEWFHFGLNTLLTLVFGFIGEFLLGYSSTYLEYYQPGSTKKN